jgi:hypothetical protein
MTEIRGTTYFDLPWKSSLISSPTRAMNRSTAPARRTSTAARMAQPALLRRSALRIVRAGGVSSPSDPGIRLRLLNKPAESAAMNTESCQPGRVAFLLDAIANHDRSEDAVMTPINTTQARI